MSQKVDVEEMSLDGLPLWEVCMRFVYICMVSLNARLTLTALALSKIDSDSKSGLKGLRVYLRDLGVIRVYLRCHESLRGSISKVTRV